MGAALRWLWGTNAAQQHPAAQEEAEKAVGEPLHRHPEQGPEMVEHARQSVARLQRSMDRLDQVMPAKNLDEALRQIAARRA